jgi:MOSC domain-containing protein YiiM
VAILLAVCISSKRSSPKRTVEKAFFASGGIEGDSHFGFNEREVSLLRREDVEKTEQQANILFPPGSLAENLLVKGLPEDLSPGTILAIGATVKLEVIEKGKKPGEPHTYDYMGWCLLPIWGYFLRVVQGGEVVPGDRVSLLETN